MKISRRNFITLGGATAFGGTNLLISATTAAQDSRSFQPRAEAYSDQLMYLTSADFRRHVGSEFLLVTDTEATPIRLAFVAQIIPAASRRRRLVAEAFSLSFETPVGFSQATYHLRHAHLGEFDLLLVPEGDNELMLHAVVNRVVK
ncbi:MAG: hypothetical protein LC734_09860 [Acidobacteria bacterium]|nr:hypothetical protein [Acidobacteriota bacterium]